MKVKQSHEKIQIGSLQTFQDLRDMEILQRFHLEEIDITVGKAQGGIYLRCGVKENGGYALRVVPHFGLNHTVSTSQSSPQELTLTVSSAMGRFDVNVSVAMDEGVPTARARVSLTPNEELVIPYWPRDLYPIDQNGNPQETSGSVLAAQRGLCSGIVYLALQEPSCGSLLYFQNFTSTQEFFHAVGSTPDSVVGGQWPELGYEPPTSENNPLKAGKTYLLLDSILALATKVEPEKAAPEDWAATYLTLLASVYRLIDKPRTVYHPWPELAETTLRNLNTDKDLTTESLGHTYIRPYVGAEYPDSMVQISVMSYLKEFQRWTNKPVPLVEKLEAGLPKFYDKQKGSLTRYLSTVGSDKDSDEIDSWYLYHPLTNLGRLALEGDAYAEELFCGCLDFVIKVAHHFKYRWPIQFKMSNLQIIKKQRKPTEPGQSDVAGIFAYVMMQAHQISGDDRYLKEAKAAMRAVKGNHFELLYQSNLTSWGVAACGLLWKQTKDSRYLDQSYIFLANLFNNSSLWSSDLGFAKHYSTFFGVACLHDGPYMALFECYETFCALSQYLELVYDDVPEPIKLLVSEHVKFGPHRAWSFYPAHLPPEALSGEVRNGHLKQKLAIPLEDLYVDGRPAGTVGQEVYGCGASFAFSTRNYKKLKSSKATIYCEVPLVELTENSGMISFRILGVHDRLSRFRVIHESRSTKSPTCSIEGYAPEITPEGHVEFRLKPGWHVLQMDI